MDTSRLFDIRAVGPPSRRPTTHHAHDTGTPDLRTGPVRAAPLRRGPYRKTRRDLSYIRIMTASAIVTGLLWGLAPVALAQIEHLFATMPAVFVKKPPAQGVSTTRDGEVKNDSTPIIITVRSRVDTHSETPMIRWTGTNEALKCSYSLLVTGNTRVCETG